MGGTEIGSMSKVKKRKSRPAKDSKPEPSGLDSERTVLARSLASPLYRKNPARWQMAFLALVVVALLLPLAGKAFNIDEPLFVWTARQIVQQPANFYGFQVNWYGFEMPMYDVTKNPPLTSYFMALVASGFGFGEVPLHTAFLLFAVAAAVGTYVLARELCLQPLAAALSSVLAPAFLVSSSAVMSDVPMLAFWIWAVVFWMEGLKENRFFYLFISATLICFSTLNKYFGIALVPLLFVYSLAEKRSLGRWAFFLVLPLAVVGLYEGLTHMLYGRGLFSDAVFYARFHGSQKNIQLFSQAVMGLSFVGGGFLTALLLIPYLCSRRAVAAGLVLTAAIFLVLSYGVPKIGDFPLREAMSGIRYGLIAQISVAVMVGLGILVIATADLVEHKNSASLLLFLWISGTFIFAAFINWTINIRSILPMAPAVGILLTRRIQSGKADALLKSRAPLPFLLLASAFLVVLVTWADASLANTARSAAVEITKKYGGQSRPLRFEGHWGFQYYMQLQGASPLDFKRPELERGTMLIIPSNNTNVVALPPRIAQIVETLEYHPCGWLTTMNRISGAGYYSSLWGPLPFALGAVPPERYHVMIMTASVLR